MKLVDIAAGFIFAFFAIISLLGAAIITLYKALAALIIRGIRFFSLIGIIFEGSNNFKTVFLAIIDTITLLFAVWFVLKPTLESAIKFLVVTAVLIITCFMISRKKRG